MQQFGDEFSDMMIGVVFYAPSRRESSFKSSVLQGVKVL